MKISDGTNPYESSVILGTGTQKYNAFDTLSRVTVIFIKTLNNDMVLPIVIECVYKG